MTRSINGIVKGFQVKSVRYPKAAAHVAVDLQCWSL